MNKFMFYLETERGSCHGVMKARDGANARHKITEYLSEAGHTDIKFISLVGVTKETFQGKWVKDAEGKYLHV